MLNTRKILEPSEAIIYTWFYHYLRDNDSALREQTISNKLVLYPQRKYPGLIGKQNIGISLFLDDKIILGISVKMQGTTPAYLDGADFTNPIIIQKYRSSIDANDFELKIARITKRRIKVPTLLQDIARIENLQTNPSHRFQSSTIVFDSKQEKEDYWVREITNEFDHRFLFLMDKPQLIFKEWVSENLISLKTL